MRGLALRGLRGGQHSDAGDVRDRGGGADSRRGAGIVGRHLRPHGQAQPGCCSGLLRRTRCTFVIPLHRRKSLSIAISRCQIGINRSSRRSMEGAPRKRDWAGEGASFEESEQFSRVQDKRDRNPRLPPVSDALPRSNALQGRGRAALPRSEWSGVTSCVPPAHPLPSVWFAGE